MVYKGVRDKGSFSEQVMPEPNKEGLLVVIQWREGSRTSRQRWAGKGPCTAEVKAMWSDCPGLTGTRTAGMLLGSVKERED